MKLLNKIINCCMTKPINYEEDVYWYENTYNMLGYKWLYDVLKNKLNLKKDFTLLSPAANLGRYEKNSYDDLKEDGFNPIFYVNDICSGKLENKEKESDEYHWIKGAGTNASQIKFSKADESGTVPVKFDVILDCKGAMWHSLNSTNKDLRETIKLLENYCLLLKTDESMLLIDYDIPRLWRRVCDIYIKKWYQIVRIRKRKVKMHFMSEYTTYFYLRNYIGEIADIFFHPLHLEINSENLKENFDIAYCTKCELEQCIRILKNITDKKYKNNLKHYKFNNVIYGLFAFSPLILAAIVLEICSLNRIWG